MTELKKVATEVAEQDFERFVARMALDVDPKHMDDEDKKSFTQAKHRLIAAIEDGTLVVNEKGTPVFSPVGDEDGDKDYDRSAITFHEPKGDALMAMDLKRDGHNVAKTFASLSAMTKQPITRFSGMANRDLRICLALYVLFLG